MIVTLPLLLTKPNKFQIRFNHTKDQWAGRVYIFTDDPPDAEYTGEGYDGVSLTLYSVARKNNADYPPRPFVKGSQGVPDAREELVKRRHPYFAKGVKINSDAEFERWFLDGVKAWILDIATQPGRIPPAPANYVNEFWTPAFIKCLAKRMARRRSKRTFLNECLDRLLIHEWPQFCTMDRYELYEKIKSRGFTSLKITPHSVWQRAYRLGLVSKRDPGPK